MSEKQTSRDHDLISSDHKPNLPALSSRLTGVPSDRSSSLGWSGAKVGGHDACRWATERIYSFLLRLYPARFRRHYGAEATALLRDRLRDERGADRKLRLCFDLLIDFATGLPQAYRNSYAMVSASTAAQSATGLPAFRTLDQEPLRPGPVLAGSVLALAALAGFVFVMNHASAWHPLSSFNALAGHSTSAPNSSVEQVAEKLNQQIHAQSPQQRCGFEKLELHPGNIGYVKLNSFPNPAQCGAIAEAVMEKLNPADAVIFDLRDNRGGFPDMVRYLADWLFDHPVPWYNPRATTQQGSFTHSPVPESRLAHTPVFILTSARSFSAAEHFTYNLKTLKRATIVGETTSGASHGPGPPPEGTIPVWEGDGVEPDVKVTAADALATAEKLALTQLSHR